MKIPSSLLRTAILSAGLTWLGMLAAVSGWHWNSQTIVGPAWNQAWLYTNMALTIGLFILFPPMLTRSTAVGGENGRVYLISHGCVLLLAPVPILITAGWLSHISLLAALNIAVLQLAFAIFTLGCAALILKCGDVGRVFVYTALVSSFLLPPALTLIQASTYPWLTGGMWSHWGTMFPAPMILLACEHSGHSPVMQWITGLYAIIGIALTGA